MDFTKKQITLFLISLVVIAGIALVYTPKESEYNNEKFGIYFDYPDNWELVGDTLVRNEEDVKHYWVSVSGPAGDVSFDIKLPRGARFVLSDEDQKQFSEIQTEEGITIIRPSDEVVLEQAETARRTSYVSGRSGDKFDFRLVFPEFNNVNNEGEVFDSGSDYIENGSFGVSITGGVDVSSSSRALNALEDIDEIVKSFKLSEPESDSFDSFSIQEDFYNTEDWQTYSNEEFGFSFKYPDDYGQFTNTDGEGLLSLTASSSKLMLINGRYNRYPNLNLEVSPVYDYEYHNIYSGTFKYDPNEDKCFIESITEERRDHPYSVSFNGWRGCEVGFGDAGFSSRGYAIPYEPRNIVLEITKVSQPGLYRPLNLESILKTLEFSEELEFDNADIREVDSSNEYRDEMYGEETETEFSFVRPPEGITQDNIPKMTYKPKLADNYGVGINLSWDPVPGADYYKVTHFRMDAAGWAIQNIHKTEGHTSGSGTHPNAGAPDDECYRRMSLVEAFNDEGEVIAGAHGIICEVGVDEVN